MTTPKPYTMEQATLLIEAAHEAAADSGNRVAAEMWGLMNEDICQHYAGTDADFSDYDDHEDASGKFFEYFVE